ncbi:MAG: MerC domain-containing protein [Pedobacter sp.]|uniref:MerC domain-containing protein n=1 Tax=Pedobacter sp. TaxID=1411316 RepID=UPI003392C1E3
MKSFIKHDRLDHLGITASIACAVHCAALPLAITALPMLGLEFLANIWVEISMICLSLLIGILSLRLSYPKHQKVLPVLILVMGFLFIGTGHFVFERLEAVIVPIGGFTIAAAHLLNWRYSRSCKHQ